MQFRGDFETLSLVYVEEDHFGVCLDDVGGETANCTFRVGIPFRNASAGDRAGKGRGCGVGGEESLGFRGGFEDGFVEGCGDVGGQAIERDGDEFFAVIFGRAEVGCRGGYRVGGGGLLVVGGGYCGSCGIRDFRSGRGGDNGRFSKVHALP